MGGETQGLRSYHWTDAAGMGYFLTEECSIKMHQHILEQLNEQRWSPDRRLHCAGKEQSTLYTPAGRDSQLQNEECKEPGTSALWLIYMKFKGRQTCRVGSRDSGRQCRDWRGLAISFF